MVPASASMGGGFVLAFWFLPGALPLLCAGTPCPRVRPPPALLCVAAVLGGVLLWLARWSR
jgi:hypothetical protein